MNISTWHKFRLPPKGQKSGQTAQSCYVSRMFLESKWGGMSLVSLYLSVVSGLILALQYDPATPYFSVSSLDLLAPYGAFFRAVHFYSSQLFFLFSLLHLAVVILQDNEWRLAWGRWLILVVSIVAGLLLLFTGYVLRADATGEAAGVIAENITLTIPLVGEVLNSLLFSIEAEGMKRIYAHHLFGLGLVWLVCAWDHLRRYRVSIADHRLLVAGTMVFSLMVAAPMEPARLGQFYIKGPWFMLGLQEMLRFIHPLWAGVVFPAGLLIALALIGREGEIRRKALFVAVVWLGAYAVLSGIAALR